MVNLDLLWVVAAGLSEPIWMVSLKKYNDSKNILWGAVVLAFMFIGPTCLSMATRGTIQVSIAYAVWVSIGAAMVTIIGCVFYKDPIDKQTLAFLAMIIAGVVGLDIISGA
jgi:multidrug transporter EmrE-like cation transporter